MQKKTKDQYYISDGERGIENILLNITLDWAHTKNGCCKSIKHVCDCFLENENDIGCTTIAKNERTMVWSLNL